MKEKALQKSFLMTGIAVIMVVFLMIIVARPVHAMSSKIQHGSYIYTTVETRGSYPDYKKKITIYRQKTGQTRQKLVSISGKSYLYLKFVYDNYLYFQAGREDDPECQDFYSLNLKTKKMKRIVSSVSVRSCYNQYVVLLLDGGDLYPLPCYVYNAKTRKAKKISDNCIKAVISAGRIYYAETAAKNYEVKQNGWKTRIYSCSLSGKDKKAKSGYFISSGCEQLTSKYVKYYRNGKYYKYTF